MKRTSINVLLFQGMCDVLKRSLSCDPSIDPFGIRTFDELAKAMNELGYRNARGGKLTEKGLLMVANRVRNEPELLDSLALDWDEVAQLNQRHAESFFNEANGFFIAAEKGNDTHTKNPAYDYLLEIKAMLTEQMLDDYSFSNRDSYWNDPVNGFDRKWHERNRK